MQETRVLTLTDSHVNDSGRDKSVEAVRHWAGSQGGELPTCPWHRIFWEECMVRRAKVDWDQILKRF